MDTSDDTRGNRRSIYVLVRRSQHLTLLKSAGFIVERRIGNSRLYRADHSALGALRTVVEDWIGGSPAKVAERYSKLSPIRYVRKEIAPLLLIHGTADGVVPSNYARNAATGDFSEALSLYYVVRGTPQEAEMRRILSNRFEQIDRHFPGWTRGR